MGRSSGGGRSGGGGFGGFSGGGRSSGGFSGGRRSGGRSLGSSPRGGSPYRGGGFGGLFGGFPTIFAPRINIGGGTTAPPAQQPYPQQPGAGQSPYATPYADGAPYAADPQAGAPGSPANPAGAGYGAPANATPGANPAGYGTPSGPNGPASPGSPGAGSASKSGCGVAFIIVAAIALALLIFGAFGGGCSADSITRSSVEREALPADAALVTPYYTDEDGDWIRTPRALEDGLRQFHDETGVWPYVYILPNGTAASTEQLAQMADRLYGELFDDEAHFLLVFCDDGDGSFNAGYAVGSQAKTIMDDEAVAVLADYLDRYYQDQSLSEEQIFSRAFADTGERIMTVTKSPVVPLAIAAVVIIAIAAVVIIVKRNRDQRERESRRMEQILNTPLEKFGDTAAEDLAAKYESAPAPSTAANAATPTPSTGASAAAPATPTPTAPTPDAPAPAAAQAPGGATPTPDAGAPTPGTKGPDA